MALTREAPPNFLRASTFLFFSFMMISNSYAEYSALAGLDSKENHIGFNYNSYMEGVNGYLDKDSFEYMFDYYNNKSKVVIEYHDEFDPVNITKLVTARAAEWNTPPSQFLEEIADLISLGDEQRSETKGNYGPDPEKRLQFLTKKYNISAECVVPDCVSLSRLELVFPHLGVIGQKPLSAQRVVIKSDGPGEETLVVHPNLLQNPRFGGLILSGLVTSDVRKTIITVHLYYSANVLYRNESVPIRTQCLMLNRRMKKSMLSWRRMRLLQHYGVLTDYYVREDISRAYSHIPDDFKQSIPFSILGPNF